MRINFTKMHGLGNDFVVVDARVQSASELMGEVNWPKLADRRRGIGCDQVIVLENSTQANVKMRIINADGSEVEACGNATRCVGALMGGEEVSIETAAGLLYTHRKGEEIAVNMGVPSIISRTLPFSGNPVEVNIGNPHLVFFVDDLQAVDVAKLGAKYEIHAAFPERTNVEFAQIIYDNQIEMRVWERGAGITQACGTGACATLVAAKHCRLIGSEANINMAGGSLYIRWQGEGEPVWMTGDANVSYVGEFESSSFR